MKEEYMVLVNGEPVFKPYHHTFDDLEKVRSYMSSSQISGKSEIALVSPLWVYFPEEKELLRGYILEHISKNGEQHLLKFCENWKNVEKTQDANPGLNLDVRKLIKLNENLEGVLIPENQRETSISPSP